MKALKKLKLNDFVEMSDPHWRKSNVIKLRKNCKANATHVARDA